LTSDRRGFNLDTLDLLRYPTGTGADDDWGNSQTRLPCHPPNAEDAMLTDPLINSLPLPKKRREIADGEVGGLYLIVQPSGAKSWAVRYRFDGMPKKVTLGPYPAIDVATARELAQEALSDVAGGKDPAVVKQAARVAAKVERETRAGRFDRRAEPKSKMRDGKDSERMLVKEIAARSEGRPPSQISRAEVHDMLDTILDRGAPIQANRIFAQLMRSWATSHGTGDLSPSEEAAAPTSEMQPDRVLSDDEIRLAWNAFDRLGWPFGPIGKLLLLTGARRDEIGLGRWSEIDFGSKTWTIAKERSKSGVAREIPLSDAAMRIIEGLPRTAGGDGFVFSTTGGTAVSRFSRAKAAIDQMMLEMIKKQAEARGDDPASVRTPARWSYYHLRQTVAWNLQRLGVKLEVAEAVLDDASGRRAGIAGVYPRREYSAERRIALAVWANRLDAIVSGPAAPESDPGNAKFQ
jgi:integrase